MLNDSINTRLTEWEASYTNKDNYVFYPHEEIVRFFSKYVHKRIGISEFIVKHLSTNKQPRVLDLGCGIGRHVIFSHEMNCDAYGIDLSNNAVKFAQDWARIRNYIVLSDKIIQGDCTKMPYENLFFDFIISHGVLDSMPISICKQVINEASRVLVPDGLFYCDLISGNDSAHHATFTGEEVVESTHEKGTIQLYFDEKMILDFFEPNFHIKELIEVRRKDVKTQEFTTRFHGVFQKK